MTEHTIKRFENELTILKEKILAMGGLVEKAVRRSMKSVLNQDAKRAHKVIEKDKAINALEMEIDSMTRQMLALRQPAAGDLRLVLATIKIVTDLERAGDRAEGIAESMLETEDHPLTDTATLETMADLVVAQIKLALDSFARSDLTTALQCLEQNKKIRSQYKAIQRETLTYMIEDPRKITAGLLATSIAGNLGRIGDHAVNIAEMVIYVVAGQDVRHMNYDKAATLVGVQKIEE